MAWSDQVKPLSSTSLATLTTWALGRRKSPLLDEYEFDPLPSDVMAGGMASVVAYAIENCDHPSAQFWSLLHGDYEKQDPAKARAISQEFENGVDWRQGFAAGAMCALDNHPAPDDFGVFQGLETSRSVLVSKSTLAQISVKTGLDKPLPMKFSFFSDPVVRETLERLDDLIIAQNQFEEWPQIVQADLQRFPNQMLQALVTAQKRFPTLQTMTGPMGTRLVTSMRALMEELLGTQQLNMMRVLDKALMIVACRFGSNRDVVLASHRAAFTNAIIFPDQATQSVVAHCLENLLGATYWLDDADAQATLHHGIGLVLRNMTRKVPGLLDAVHHMERAITLRRSLGQTIEAFGTQIDLTTILIQFGPMLGMLDESYESAPDRELLTEAYLQEAIEGLSRIEDNPVAKAYLGEAFHNLARLYQTQAKPQQAVSYAQAAMEISKEVADQDLEARASVILGELLPNEKEAQKYQNMAARLVQDVRRGMAEENVAVAWVGNKQGVFSSQIDFLLGEALQVTSEAQVCRLLLSALEEGRGLTYNRWLGVNTPFNVKAIEQALAEEKNTVLAAYAVGQQKAGVVLMSGTDAPSLHVFEMSPTQIETLTIGHLAGLKQQGYVRQAPLWDALQKDFKQEGAQLVAPLEKFVQEEKSLCIIPHGLLHAVAFHTLSGEVGGEPLGLRVPVFSNPSLTNWLLCRSRTINTPTACLATAAPFEEKQQFESLSDLRDPIEKAGFAVQHISAGTADRQTLAGTWGILHLVCHGLFRQQKGQYGLLLAANGSPPPQPLGSISTALFNEHLATPAKLRESKVGGQITFLSACVSARNEEMPGDDLMGVTRAIFSSGAVSLIAGSWTVNSNYVRPFAEVFYSQLKHGSVAEALLQARRATSKMAKDPFFWGAFVLQGADATAKLGEE